MGGVLNGFGRLIAGQWVLREGDKRRLGFGSWKAVLRFRSIILLHRTGVREGLGVWVILRAYVMMPVATLRMYGEDSYSLGFILVQQT